MLITYFYLWKKWIELTNIETISQRELMKNIFLMIFAIDTFKST